MQRNTYSRDGLRSQRPTRLSTAVSGGTGPNAYARVQRVRRQAAIQSQRDVAARLSEDLAVNGDNEQNIEEAEAAVLQEIEVIDLTEEVLPQQTSAHSSGRYRYKQTQYTRNASLESSHRSRTVYKLGDTDLKLGACVELRQALGNWDVEFIEIKSIWVSRSDGSVVIRGLPYTRTRNLRGFMEKKQNEVCQVFEIDVNDQRSDEAQALIEIRPQQILQVRTLNKTNAEFPQYRFGAGERWSRKAPNEREHQAPITCRWKFRVQYKDCRFRQHDKPNDWAFARMSEAEADERFRAPDEDLRKNWRGETHRGGSYMPRTIHSDRHGVPMDRNDRQYIFADMFCGAGGASHGAVLANLKLAYGVDHWPLSCATWRRNFPAARMCEQDMTDFIHDPEFDYRSHPVDILHLSPPCQFWSPLAYPHAGRMSQDNETILLACSNLIKKIRPRLFTLEQTFGLLHDGHAYFLSALIHGFTSQGKKVRLVEYGLPQERERLIMIGACPGEQLPPWPLATHAQRPTGSQKPYKTEAQALRRLDNRRDPLHNVAHAIVRDNPPRDGNAPFPRTILGSGTQGGSHFSGLRDYTLREIACLQGFPVSHQFEGTRTAIKQQIGNAFPSCVAEAFYNHLRGWLQQVDSIQSTPAQVGARRFPDPWAIVPIAGRPQGNPAPGSTSNGTRHFVNGELDEDEALELALQESRRENHSTAIIELSDEDDVLESVLQESRREAHSIPIIELSDEDEDEQQQYSPVSAVGPMLERMSIAPSEHEAVASIEAGDRSRSVTLDVSPEPSPGPSHHAKTASQKRSLDSMHDGEADAIMKEESPPKRERVVDTHNHNRSVAVCDGKIPSRLPRYAGPPRPYDADGEIVAVGQPERRNGDRVQPRKSSHKNSSIRQGEGSHGTTIVDDVAPSKPDGEEDVWTF